MFTNVFPVVIWARNKGQRIQEEIYQIPSCELRKLERTRRDEM